MWVEKEFKTLHLRNERLERRFLKAMNDFSENPEKSIWLASGNRANAKAVYRMLRNEDLEKESILAAHREASIERSAGKTVLLAVQDTMAVNYAGHKKTEGMGYNCEQTRGINVHSCLMLTPDGIPLGLLAQKVITREEPADKRLTKAEKRIKPIEEKESYRWLETMNVAAANAPELAELVHTTDREGDIYELYAQAIRTEQKFVIRAIYDRVNTNNEHIQAALYATKPVGKTKVKLSASRKRKATEAEAVLTIRYGRFEIRKPRGKGAEIETSLQINLISLREETPPEGVEAVEWLLMTNLPVESGSDAIRVAEYYKQRWKIERFHYVLKSACAIEKIQQRNVDGIELMILLYSIIAIHIMQLTFLSRQYPHMPCSLLFAENEWTTLYRAANRTKQAPEEAYSLTEAVRYIAKLAGFSGTKSDGPPGLKVIWIGLNALYTLLAFREFI